MYSSTAIVLLGYISKKCLAIVAENHYRKCSSVAFRKKVSNTMLKIDNLLKKQMKLSAFFGYNFIQNRCQ